MEQLRMIHTMHNIPSYSLAGGFSLRMYRPGDEAVWTEICRQGILPQDAGVECWEKYILAIDSLIPERDTFFICQNNGNAIATCTSFVHPCKEGRLHMLGVTTEARGHRLGYAMTAYALAKLREELPDNNKIVRLRTDDWRLPAIKIYLQCGFQPVLYTEDMVARWQAVCDNLNIHGIEMLDKWSCPTSFIL